MLKNNSMKRRQHKDSSVLRWSKTDLFVQRVGQCGNGQECSTVCRKVGKVEQCGQVYMMVMVEGIRKYKGSS